ncbi:MAG: cell shape determination protein CcmA [Bacteroidetes bacterium]|nr:MAG: cell shape determination protein CcmA [Bacteroidota bacterium]
MAKGNEPQTANVSLIGTGTEIKGEIKCAGDLRVDGSVVGNLQVKGKLVIGEAGFVQGEVVCANSDISGELQGKIVVSEILSLKSSSKFTGEITAKRLSIEPGCQFNGSCQMGQANLPKETPKPQQ